MNGAEKRPEPKTFQTIDAIIIPYLFMQYYIEKSNSLGSYHKRLEYTSVKVSNGNGTG